MRSVLYQPRQCGRRRFQHLRFRRYLNLFRERTDFEHDVDSRSLLRSQRNPVHYEAPKSCISAVTRQLPGGN